MQSIYLKKQSRNQLHTKIFYRILFLENILNSGLPGEKPHTSRTIRTLIAVLHYRQILQTAFHIKQTLGDHYLLASIAGRKELWRNKHRTEYGSLLDGLTTILSAKPSEWRRVHDRWETINHSCHASFRSLQETGWKCRTESSTSTKATHIKVSLMKRVKVEREKKSDKILGATMEERQLDILQRFCWKGSSRFFFYSYLSTSDGVQGKMFEELKYLFFHLNVCVLENSSGKEFNVFT